jgi:hypothetical protein
MTSLKPPGACNNWETISSTPNTKEADMDVELSVAESRGRGVGDVEVSTGCPFEREEGRSL